MGTKEVLYRTRELGWGSDTHMYSTVEEFRAQFPATLVSNRIRVLKQNRGNGGVGVWKVTPHVQDRVTIWLHPWTVHKVYCPLSGGPALRQNCQSFQLVKSLYSIGNGQFGGTGLGKGTFATTSGAPIIPDLNTDFIYSALAQELGLIGVAALLLVYMIFVLRGMRIALLAQDGFSKLAAAGLTFGFALQTFIIVGGILRLIPLTGITLPFVSYGGSSVVANFLLLAGLLLISNRANREALR